MKLCAFKNSKKDVYYNHRLALAKIGSENMFKIEDHKQDIKKICRDLRVKRLDLVGSASRGEFEPERSDVDVLVQFDGLDRLFDRYFELKKRLESQLGREVDVIEINAVKNPYVKKSLNRDKVRIYES